MDIDGGAAKAIKGTTQQITKLTQQKIKQVSGYRLTHMTEMEVG